MSQTEVDQQNVAVEVEPQTIAGVYKSISERLGQYRVSLINARNDLHIMNALGRFNYSPERLDQGLNLVENATQADAANKKEYGEQYAASERLDKEFAEASGPYIESLSVARIALKKDSNAAKALVLNGARERALAKWLHNAELFYRNLLSTGEFLEKMNNFGRTREALEAEYREIRDVVEAMAIHKKEMGEALESTTVRNKIMAELDDWMEDFYNIAKLALPGQPESLKKLGL